MFRLFQHGPHVGEVSLSRYHRHVNGFVTSTKKGLYFQQTCKKIMSSFVSKKKSECRRDACSLSRYYRHVNVFVTDTEQELYFQYTWNINVVMLAKTACRAITDMSMVLLLARGRDCTFNKPGRKLSHSMEARNTQKKGKKGKYKTRHLGENSVSCYHRHRNNFVTRTEKGLYIQQTCNQYVVNRQILWKI